MFLFIKRPEEKIETVEDDETEGLKSLWPIIPAICVLITAGYFLDPIVTFASEQSKAPKGVIGFFILASLSIWPEFKTCLVFMNRRKYQSAILNIIVSNITNIWLAILGVSAYLVIG
jgi:cation:H+ antiporter